MNAAVTWKDGYSLGRLAEIACVLEVTASKPGNVHRGADFEDVTFLDFAASAVAMGQAIDESVSAGYGETVLAVANRTMQVAGSNTNLGINLLISLLVVACRGGKFLDRASVDSSLQQLDADDSSKVFEAIRLMIPGGMGNVTKHSITGAAPTSLIEAMEAAKDRDLVAAQFTNGFVDGFDKALPWICEGRARFDSLVEGIVWAHVRMMASCPDTLIARKCGLEVAQQSSAMASKAIDELQHGREAFFSAVSNLDFWLRSDGHRRNPGASADMVAAGLFVGLYNGDITPPFSSQEKF